MSIGSRFQKSEPSLDTWIVTLSGGGWCGSGGVAAGRSIGTDWMRFRERVKSTNVASRKKMTSSSVMISMGVVVVAGTCVLESFMRVWVYGNNERRRVFLGRILSARGFRRRFS